MIDVAQLVAAWVAAAVITIIVIWRDRRRVAEARKRVQEIFDELPAGPSMAEVVIAVETPIMEKVRASQEAMQSGWEQAFQRARQAQKTDARNKRRQVTMRRLAKARREGSLVRW